VPGRRAPAGDQPVSYTPIPGNPAATEAPGNPTTADAKPTESKDAREAENARTEGVE
jgi:hypothetical protein